ncbi:hypothetical protein TSAR_012273 [Trichomalopsis sarcophagae]|uniref:HTH psq-type domain-containing protein n=1 Tax=Trichomalopsis sarcophagae TaxID=543379 RepID=A0A232FN45_9HYME|nr:hypothetical protein TSAR_012273 [Trichomalopsis sarcophagae]
MEYPLRQGRRGRRAKPVPVETLKAALHALNEGMSFRKAAEVFGITKSTLQRIKAKQRSSVDGVFLATVNLDISGSMEHS